MVNISYMIKRLNLIWVPILFLSACAQNPDHLAYIPIRPVCFSEGDLQVSYFYKCLNAIPEERRTAADLKQCDDVSIVQATTQCASMGLEP